MIPQLDPPPPLRAQNKSVFYLEFAVASYPLASTMSISRILSTPKPLLGAKGP